MKRTESCWHRPAVFLPAVLALLFSWPDTTLRAQPCSGLAMEYAVIVPGEGGKNEAVTLIRDAFQPGTWYYAATRPRLVSKDGVPVFSITEYQTKDPANPQKLVQGAFFQFSVQLDPSPEALGKLPAAAAGLSRKLGGPDEIRLSPLPYKQIRLWTFSPTGALLAEGAADQKEMVTGFSSAEIPFTVSLSAVGADLLRDLCEKGTGIPVWVQYSYAAVSAPVGFEVTVNWEQTFKHLSTSANSTTAVGYAGVGLSYAVDRTKIRETLTANKCLSVKVVGDTKRPVSDLDRYLDPILQSVYDELFDPDQTRIKGVNVTAARSAQAPPKSQEPFAMPIKPTSGLIQHNTFFALKKVDKVRKGTQLIELSRRRQEEGRGGCGGFIGIGDYLARNPGMRDRLITVAQAADWPDATFLLPKLEGAREMGVAEVTLSLAIFDDAGQVRGDGTQQSVRWTAAGSGESWRRLPGNEPADRLLFPMASLYDRYRGRLEVLNYRVGATITVNRNGSRVMKTERLVPLVNGDVPLASPLSCVDLFRVNAEALEFGKDGLSEVQITLVDPIGRQSVKIDGASADKRPAFLFPTADEGKAPAIRASFRYLVGGKAIESGLNQLGDVRSLGPEIFLFPEWEGDGAAQAP